MKDAELRALLAEAAARPDPQADGTPTDAFLLDLPFERFKGYVLAHLHLAPLVTQGDKPLMINWAGLR